MSDHVLFTTWSGVPGEPDIWCLTCTKRTGDGVPWDQCEAQEPPETDIPEEAAPLDTLPCPGQMPFSAFGADNPDTMCSQSLTWEEGTRPSVPTLCDMDDDGRPTGPPCPYNHQGATHE